MDHLQPHVNLEHVDHPEEALARHCLTEPREIEEEKHTSNSRTMEGETELRLQLRETTVCDSQRGIEDTTTEARMPAQSCGPMIHLECTPPMPKHLQS